MEPRALTRWTLAFVAAVVLLGGGLYAWKRREPNATGAARVERMVPPDVRIKVEVINESGVQGLGRRATLYLRECGFDVVRYAGGDGPVRDSTVVQDRSGQRDFASLARKALGGVPVVAVADSGRFVDLTVRLGRTWRPPTKTFYP